MKAIGVTRDGDEPELLEIERPEPADGEALVRTLRVGVDGTDHEVIAGAHGGYPEGEDYMILGHEAVGVVADPNGTGLEEGQVVVPTVRRKPDGETNEYFRRGEPDMAPDGEYFERGIVGAHGYMAEYFTSPADYLVPISEDLAEYGLFVEPISITEKANEHAFATREPFEWRPETACVLGNGSLGLLTLWMLGQQFDRTYCVGRRDRPDPTIDVIEELGATYVDSRQTSVDEIPEAHEAIDYMYEATGFAPHAIETVHALAPNGVGALLGIPEPWDFEVDGGSLHNELVLHNKCLVGTVNSHVKHFEYAIDTLEDMPEWLLDDLITTVAEPENVTPAFVDDDDQIKAVVEFDTL
ncbi:glucose 1-dehydrogenase [Halomicroarcula sp. S1AR25-4]|uniref:glucose 1-dehydrogenase n=1 Tax=Haloarcula sp. S1AR25-4 TaxID=2950538 RepID=UPI002874277A|nr:glucose 1-dehydrogenase [Halomicroarcula sp. S1AR25-4]MDS0276642.1 glucose 1-dehydrogenase [Halomicroarcula sp. S1AR25-4]